MQRRYEKGKLVWVSPNNVLYDGADIDILLPWLQYMREGDYPVEPSGGYVEGKSSRTTRAYYEAACQVAAEIDRRLAMTGTDRELVEKHYCLGYTDEDIARHYHMDLWEVSRRINSAVSYIASGPCPRWLPCPECGKRLRCIKLERLLNKGQKRITYTYDEWTRYRNREEGRKLKYTK